MRHLLTLRYIDAIARAGSIRKAAESLSITSTALNRRILSMEQELGAPIFERMATGVRLSAAGEILVQHARAQIADMERIKSQISDLSASGAVTSRSPARRPFCRFFFPSRLQRIANVIPA